MDHCLIGLLSKDNPSSLPIVSIFTEYSKGPHPPPCCTISGIFTLSVKPTGVFTATRLCLLYSYTNASFLSLILGGNMSYRSFMQSTNHKESNAWTKLYIRISMQSRFSLMTQIEAQLMCETGFAIILPVVITVVIIPNQPIDNCDNERHNGLITKK